MTEPAKENVLFGRENVIATPHLGASTTEAQENVAVQVAEQMCDYLINGAITNALNFPSISADEAPKLKPFIELAEHLGSFVGQATESAIKSVRIEYAGDVAEMNTKALTAAALAGLLSAVEGVNRCRRRSIAKERGIAIEEVRRGQDGAYDTYMRLTVTTPEMTRSIGGTVFSDGRPRIIQIKGINIEAEFAPHMLYVTNEDKPGFIGRFGMLLGEAGVNIATFNLGRDKPGGDAICLVTVDEPVPEAVLASVPEAAASETGAAAGVLSKRSDQLLAGGCEDFGSASTAAICIACRSSGTLLVTTSQRMASSIPK